MTVRILAFILLAVLMIVSLMNGCACRMNTAVKQAIDKIFYISTSEQRHQLKGLQTQEEGDLKPFFIFIPFF